MKKVVSVALLTREIARLLDEGIGVVSVSGEVSNYKHHTSGHRYFTLKDSAAQIAAVMWRGRSLGFVPRDGMKVVATGAIAVHPPHGKYQIDCYSLVLQGIGDLHAAFEELKQELHERGWFNQEHKKELPRIPLSVGIATSPTGAALQDILTTLQRRMPACRVIFRPTMVQGEDSAEDIVNAIRDLNKHEVDVIIIGRGGGSMEDLWSFNTEIVAEAIFRSDKPIISAVGHETDFTIADFVADYRAATPTAAAELATPTTAAQFLELIRRSEQSMKLSVVNTVITFKDIVSSLGSRAALRRIRDAVNSRRQLTDELEERMSNAVRRTYQENVRILNRAAAHCESLHPLSPLRKGFALIKKNNVYLSRQSLIEQNDNIEIHTFAQQLAAVVKEAKQSNAFIGENQ